MLASKLYSPTLREIPADAVVKSHQYMLKAGMMRKLANGLYTFLPLAFRSIYKLETIIREEMAAIECQEILMPIVQPAEIWQQSGRWDVYGQEMFRLKDRHDHEYCLGPTHEEMVTTLVHLDISSYKQLPISVFQMQNKYRDEKRPRFGLMRSREFIMKDAYTFDIDEAGLDKQYQLMYDAYTRIFTRCGLNFRQVLADSGAIGGSGSHEFEVIADSGEADIVYCENCDFAANVEAVLPNEIKGNIKSDKEKECVATPGKSTIEAVCDFLHIPVEQSIKAVVYKLDDKIVLALVRGDHEVNEVRLQNLYAAVDISMATGEDLESVGLVGGYISPVGLSRNEKLDIIVDTTVMSMEDACCGGNAPDTHYIHVNPKRDFGDVRVETIRIIDQNDVCPKCGGIIHLKKGIEVGQVFKLGTKYSEKLGCTYLDNTGKSHPMVMGCYGIGVTRTIAASIEQNHDDDGIIWPVAIAPYEVVVVPANNKDEEVMAVAGELYEALQDKADNVVLDDRNERAGIKFKDADLIGYPLRVTVGKKWKESGVVEIKLRRTGEVIEVAKEDCQEKVKSLLQEFHEKEFIREIAMVPVELEQWQHLYKKNQEKDHMMFVKIMPELKQREVTPLFDTAYEKKWKLLFSSFQYKKNELIEKMRKRK